MLTLFASVINNIPGVYQPTDDLENQITSFALSTVLYCALALVVLVIIAALVKNKSPHFKMPLFILMVLAMAGSTISLIGSTVYLNVSAESGGPIHWHADIEYWACGNELELRDPTGFLSNKIGTSTLHEHNDKRIHLEGVVVDKEIDASIGKFMNVVGGAITDDNLVVPLNEDVTRTYEDVADGDGATAPNPQLVDPYIVQDPDDGRVASFATGQTCGDQEAEVQTFVYRYDGDTNSYQQFKLDDESSLEYFEKASVKDYSIFENSNVPPGDCIIFEFDVPKEKTDKLCEQYGIRDVLRCQEFGVSSEQRDICKATQLDYNSEADYRIQPENDDEMTDQILPTDSPTTASACLVPENPDAQADFTCNDTPQSDGSAQDNDLILQDADPNQPVTNQEQN